MSVLSRLEFHSEEAAFEYLEGKIWADCVVCVHCGGMDRYRAWTVRSWR